MVTTKDGKLLYVSENVIEYLGHSAVRYVTPSLSAIVEEP